jgi:hypothetical protein
MYIIGGFDPISKDEPNYEYEKTLHHRPKDHATRLRIVLRARFVFLPYAVIIASSVLSFAILLLHHGGTNCS